MMMMNIFELLPWQGIAEHLRRQAEAGSGIQGAIVGAGFGAATAMAKMANSDAKDRIRIIATGAALGAALGAADNSHFRDLKGG
jgi:hypothetical protein